METEYPVPAYDEDKLDELDKELIPDAIDSSEENTEPYTTKERNVVIYLAMYCEIAKYGAAGSTLEVTKLNTNLDKTTSMIYTMYVQQQRIFNRTFGVAGAKDEIMEVLKANNATGEMAMLVKILENNISAAYCALQYYKLKYGKQSLLCPRVSLGTESNIETNYLQLVYVLLDPNYGLSIHEKSKNSMKYFETVFEFNNSISSLETVLDFNFLIVFIERICDTNILTTVVTRRKGKLKEFKNITLLLPNEIQSGLIVSDVLVFKDFSFRNHLAPVNLLTTDMNVFLFKNENTKTSNAFPPLKAICRNENNSVYEYRLPVRLCTQCIMLDIHNNDDQLKEVMTNKIYKIVFVFNNKTTDELRCNSVKGSFSFVSHLDFVIYPTKELKLYVEGKQPSTAISSIDFQFMTKTGERPFQCTVKLSLN